MIIVDANVILRYLLNDNQEQSKKAQEILEEKNITVRFEVIAEVVYVLYGVYQISRKEISHIIIEFLQPENILVEDKHTLIMALDYYSCKKLDFVDLVLLAYAKNHHSKIISFDKKLNKEIGNLQKREEDE
jgi:predicted nucleic-acid-binding protein